MKLGDLMKIYSHFGKFCQICQFVNACTFLYCVEMRDTGLSVPSATLVKQWFLKFQRFELSRVNQNCTHFQDLFFIFSPLQLTACTYGAASLLYPMHWQGIINYYVKICAAKTFFLNLIFIVTHFFVEVRQCSGLCIEILIRILIGRSAVWGWSLH